MSVTQILAWVVVSATSTRVGPGAVGTAVPAAVSAPVTR